MKVLKATNSTEVDAIFKRERNGEFKIIRMARGDSNAAWMFTVYVCEQPSLPLEPTPQERKP